MIRIFLIHILYREVIDDEAKAYRSGFVFPESVYDLALVVPILCQLLLEQLLHNYFCLW